MTGQLHVDKNVKKNYEDQPVVFSHVAKAMGDMPVTSCDGPYGSKKFLISD